MTIRDFVRSPDFPKKPGSFGFFLARPPRKLFCREDFQDIGDDWILREYPDIYSWIVTNPHPQDEEIGLVAF
jgi:hypothetical protein